MKKIFLLAFANIRKSKGHTVSLFIMFMISALLLNSGLLVNFKFGSFFDKIVKDLNTSDVYYIIPDSIYNDDVDQYLKNHDNITEQESENVLWAYARTNSDEEGDNSFFVINDAEHERNLSKWKFIGEHMSLEDMSVYLPYSYQLDSNYKINDKLDMYFNDIKVTFTVKGFIEDVYFSSSETGVTGIYVSHDTFTKVTEKLGSSYQAKLYYVNMKEQNKDIELGIKERINSDKASSFSANPAGSMHTIDFSMLKMSRVLMATMVSIVIVAFAAIIVTVCLIVVRYRISDSIEDDMTKIGSLKAIGYTSRQIIYSIVMQFFIIAFTGSILGILLSYLTTPALSDVFAKQSGLRWIQGFDGIISSISLVVILLFIVIIAYLAAGRINRLSPIVALRGGIITHSFRKNPAPLEKSKGSLPIVLAIKSLIQNKKQSLMMVIILIAISFAGTFAIVMFYNTSVDMKVFFETPGVELSNTIAVLKPETDTTVLSNQVRNMKDVRKAQFVDEVKASIDDNEVYVFVMEDYSSRETDTIYQGRYPQHSNEISIAGHLADLLDKKIGEKIILKVGDREETYIISGLNNGSYMGGMFVSISYEGMLKINPEFKQQSLQIYLKKGVKSSEYIKELKSQYGDSLLSEIDMDREIELGASVYADIIAKVGIVILVFTIVVVMLVLYFVINSSVTRRKKDLGIQKAIGFTTIQLMNQLSLGFLPPITVGVILGCLLGALQINKIMTMAQRSMGIMKANYTILPAWVIMFGAGIVIISYITSMLITYRIRKISAFALVSE